MPVHAWTAAPRATACIGFLSIQAKIRVRRMRLHVQRATHGRRHEAERGALFGIFYRRRPFSIYFSLPFYRSLATIPSNASDRASSAKGRQLLSGLSETVASCFRPLMGNSFTKHAHPPPSRSHDEDGARLLGLQNNLKQSEIDTLIDYYKKMDPENEGLLPEQFKQATGDFFATELTIDPKLVFNIFDIAEGGVQGRVTLREFILGYAVLCRGTTESRLNYLFSIYDNSQDGKGFLSRDQLCSALKLVQRIASELTDSVEQLDGRENETRIQAVADQIIADSSDPKNEAISYADFIEQLKSDDNVTEWLDELQSAAGEHLKYIEKRELDLAQLNMQRNGLLQADTSPHPHGSMEWNAPSSTPSSSSSGKRPRIPKPKKQKLVRRDLKHPRLDLQRSASRKDDADDDANEDLNAAMPFIINYDDIKFGKILGRGACATVYECQWMHVPVAVKVFKDGRGDAAGVDKLSTSVEESRRDVVGDYVEEFWLLLQIRHPNCLLYMGICFEPVVCIVTELYTGGSVANYLHGPNPRRFAPQKAVEMLCGVARGMYYLHASSPPILHRDLKTSNILINQALTHCVICDFGLSRQFVSNASGVHLSSSGKPGKGGIVGTPYTMAPEIMELKPYTPAADVYSFGIVMYEMYTGRFPFAKKTPIQVMFHVVEGNRPPFCEEDRVPKILENLIKKCWAQNPDDRPSFEEILNILTSDTLATELSQRQTMSVKRRSLLGSAHEEPDEEPDEDDLAKRLLEAVYRGQTELVGRLIDRGAKVNYSDYDKRTALHVAAAEGRTACIRLLISAGARLSFDRWNNSPLVDAMNYANRSGDSEPIRLLRSIEGRISGHVEGSGILDSHHKENLLNQAAMIAAADGDVGSMSKLIMTGLDVNCSDYDRRTPLMVASSEGRRDIVQLLLQNGADVDHRDRWGSTAIHEAERGGYHDILQLLTSADKGVSETSPVAMSVS
ncbi:Serine/threonine protein kinase [Gracilaria domingensis]|nr:Serine/threonine protein kinase [Gracilaria domingensis]